MTIREITALRRSGQLSEALQAAEAEFAQNANKFTAGALFWCLNDLLKQPEGEVDIPSTVERMRSLYNDHCAGDEYMQKSLASAERRVLPHFQEISTAVDGAKNGGDARAAHRLVSGWYNAGELDPSLYPQFGWLTYYALKQTNLNDTQARKLLLNQYIKLDLPKPSVLHSLILSEAVKVEKTTPLQFRIRDFVRLWGLENLRDEDWEQFHTDDGNTLSSLVEKLISVYARELKTDHVASPDDFSQLVDKALVAFPQNQYQPLYMAIVLTSQGKGDEALAYFRNMILKSPSKFFLWNQAADLVEDTDTKIGLICRALSCGADDKFIGKIQLRLASLLIEKGMLSQAKYQLEKHRATYQNNGWNLKPEFWELFNKVASADAATTDADVFAEYSAKADEFIYSSFPTLLAVKVGESQSDDRNHPGRKITTLILRTEKSTLRLRKPAKYGLPRRIPNGTAFDVKVQDDKIVWIKPRTSPVITAWLKEHTGEVHLRTDRYGHSYTMISGSYVGEKLLKGISEGSRIKVLSIRQSDGRWSAIALLEH